MQSVSEILETVKTNRISVLKISKESGIPSSRIYKWLDPKSASHPKAADSERLKEWAARHLEKVPNSGSNGTRETLGPSKAENVDNTDYRALYIEQLRKDNEEKSEIIRANLTTIIANLTGLAVGSKMLQAHLTTALEYYALEIAGGDKKKAAKIKDDMDTRVVELLKGETKKNTFSGAGS